MRLNFSARALRDYRGLPKNLNKIADKQFTLLLCNFKHPSLHTKKYDENYDIWQARISRDYRFYFRIKGDLYEIVTIIKHPK
ncbi:hypothetical protein HYV91_00525 [Candidatus Wolfebacteria bacterium]|nr:hypothetical protein [Candidatus Wolfebacteria bacterium]